MRLRSLHRAYPSLHPFGVVHWVPEQLNKPVTGACKLIDGCSSRLQPSIDLHAPVTAFMFSCSSWYIMYYPEGMKARVGHVQ